MRGWLWAKGLNKDLVLVGYTLGASIALEYALDYPDEVKGIIIMTGLGFYLPERGRMVLELRRPELREIVIR